MKRYAFTIGLAVCTAVVMIFFAVAVFAERVPPYALVTQEGSAEVMKDYAVETGNVRLSVDGKAEWSRKGFLTNNYEDYIWENDYLSERNKLVQNHRSFMRGHLHEDSFYEDDKVVIGASADFKQSAIFVRVFELPDGKVREISVTLTRSDAAKNVSPDGSSFQIQDIQLVDGKLHFLLQEIHRFFSEKEMKTEIYSDYIVDYSSGTLLERKEIYRSPEQTDPYTETSVAVISEEDDFKSSPNVMLHIKTMYRQDIKDQEAGIQTENSKPILKERRLMGYEYASGTIWDMPRQGTDLIGTGLEPKLHGGKVYAYNRKSPRAAVFFIDLKTGEQTAARLNLEQLLNPGTRQIMLADGLIFTSFVQNNASKITVYDAETQSVVYRGEVEAMNSRTDGSWLGMLAFNHFGK